MEDFLVYFDFNPDFESFYEKLKVGSKKIICLTVPVIEVKNLKSGFHYITSLFSNLLSITHLQISGIPQQQNTMPFKAVKALNKGFKNYLKEKGQLVYLKVNNFNTEGNPIEVSEQFFSALSGQNKMQRIIFSSTNLLNLTNGFKSLGTIITNLNNLQEISLINNALQTSQQAKEIADSLMRAKQL